MSLTSLADARLASTIDFSQDVLAVYNMPKHNPWFLTRYVLHVDNWLAPPSRLTAHHPRYSRQHSQFPCLSNLWKLSPRPPCCPLTRRESAASVTRGH
eukprot:777411-Amphidinium_carterae.2